MSRAISRLGAVGGLVFILIVAIAGAYAIGLLGAPTVVDVDNRFGDVNESTTIIETNITVSNPNPIGVSLSDLSIDYTVRLNDIPIANGSKQGINLETGNSTLPFTTAMTNKRIPPWWVSHIQNNENSTLQVEANVTSGLVGRSVTVTPVERPITTDILSAFNSTETRPVNADSPLVSDPVLYINETWASWGTVTSERTTIQMGFLAYNPKPVPYTITEIRYTISMNDIQVGEGQTAREYVIPPKDTETIDATTAIKTPRLDEWWVSHLQNNQVTTLRIEFEATIELPTRETIDVPLDQLTYTDRIETDFFDNKPAIPDTDSDATSDSETTDDEQTASPTQTQQTTENTDSLTNQTTSILDSDDDGGGDSSPTPTPTQTPEDDGSGNETLTDTDIL